MASSQVEVATSNPFGGVLRDHNSCRDRRRETNGNSNHSPKSQTGSFQRNFKDLVRGHLHSCISLSPRESSDHETDENSDQQRGGFSCFGGGGNASSSSRATATVAGTGNQKSSGKKDKDVCNKQPQAQSQAQGKGKDKAQVKARSENQTSYITGSAKKERRDASPAKSEGSNSDFSVSSLVQKWRGFEAHRSACPPAPTPISTATSMETVGSAPVERVMSRANSGTSTIESALTTADEREEEMSSVDERDTRTITEEEEEMEEKEREKERERERIRVADIVRKWSGDESRVCLARLKIRRDNKAKDDFEGRNFSPNLVSTPRIRGRKAISDLFMMLERERYEELEDIGSQYAVTTFSHRGRIQAVLRLRLFRRDQTIEEQKRPQRPPLPPSKVVGSTRGRTASSITSLKEKFNSSADHTSAHQRSTSKLCPSLDGARTASSSKHISEKQRDPKVQKFVAKKEQETVNASASSKESIEAQQPKRIPDKKSVSTIPNECPKKILTELELSIPTHSDSHANAVTSDEKSELSNAVFGVPRDGAQSSEAVLKENGYEEDTDVDVEETEASYDGYWRQGEAEDCYCGDPEASRYYFEPNLDWISDIARPRSYWEDLRKAWYREVFNTRSQNEEIRQLLERGSVSNVLASDFREKMDHLLTNRVHGETQSSLEEQEHGQEADEENRRQLLEWGCVSAVLASDFGERIEQLVMNRMQKAMPSEEQNEHIPTASKQVENDRQEDDEEEDEQEDNEEDDEEEDGEIVDEREHESSFMHPYQNDNDFYGQNSSPSPSNWDEHDDESNYYSDNAEIVSIQETSPVTSYDRGTQNPSIEMELIYDLRSHMEQLYREMAELRKSVTSCMDMQMKMQHSLRKEVSTAIMYQGSSSKSTKKAEKKDSRRRKHKKGSCCICHGNKVDCLLYRCGHMCACFTCANELQWSSGKCPICRAQILDVVRAYPDS